MQSIFIFFKKSQTFIWAESQIEVMNKLKVILTMTSALIFIDYFKKADKIIIEADENKSEWENTLNQIKKEIKKKYFIHYESEFLSDMKRKYDVIKQECHAVLKMLKKCQHYLWEVHFILKLDMNIMMIQLERAVTDFSEILIMQWIMWIQLFNFEVKHVSESRHTTVNRSHISY